jgi:hypothetical protein
MRAQRIKTVFHGIGLTLAVVFGVPGVLLLGWALSSYYAGHQHDTILLRGTGVTAVIVAAAGYAAARALGWIIARIFGDSDQTSN